MTPEAFQSNLNKCYETIEAVSDHSGIARWRTEMLPFLRSKCTITSLPWYWPNQNVNAITIRPYLIWVTKYFFEKPIEKRSAILCHEACHVRQYFDNRLTWFEYVFDRHKRLMLEAEGEAEEKLFLEKYKAYNHA